jgi:hypothetical protein
MRNAAIAVRIGCNPKRTFGAGDLLPKYHSVSSAFVYDTVTGKQRWVEFVRCILFEQLQKCVLQPMPA